MSATLDSVLHADSFIVSTLDRALAVPHHYLADEAAHTALVTIGYFNCYMRDARGLPWHLARGDIAANLERFSRQPRPAHECTSQNIWDLIQSVGGVEPELVSGVSLFKDVSWSSDVVEFGHKHAAQVVRRH